MTTDDRGGPPEALGEAIVRFLREHGHADRVSRARRELFGREHDQARDRHDGQRR